jgi:hypothetical protein
MVAPMVDSNEFYPRCDEGYDEVKYINQVLAKDRYECVHYTHTLPKTFPICRQAKPRPACLIIDLGNGTDLEATQGAEQALTERIVSVRVRGIGRN